MLTKKQLEQKRKDVLRRLQEEEAPPHEERFPLAPAEVVLNRAPRFEYGSGMSGSCARALDDEYDDDVTVESAPEVARFVVVLAADAAPAPSPSIEIICIHADAFESVDQLIAWCEDHVPSFIAAAAVPPYLYIVGTRDINRQESLQLSRIGAVFSQTDIEIDSPSAERTLLNWLSIRFPPIELAPAPSPEPRAPVKMVSSHDKHTPSSVDAWWDDRQRADQSHARALIERASTHTVDDGGGLD